MSEKKQVSRRQFLNYTLTGVGGFMAAGMLSPMIGFAIDPILRKETETGMVAVVQESEITNEPKRFDYKVKVKDAWYNAVETKSAWVYKDGSTLIALSPVCKHLGCTVDWNTDKEKPNHFYCPCHGGLYTKDGTNVPKTPPLGPLDVYEHEIKDGTLYLGKAKPRG